MADVLTRSLAEADPEIHAAVEKSCSGSSALWR